MIVTKIINDGVKNMKFTYSNLGYLIRKIGTNEIYENVYDLLDSNYEYEETDELIEEVQDEENNGEV